MSYTVHTHTCVHVKNMLRKSCIGNLMNQKTKAMTLLWHGGEANHFTKSIPRIRSASYVKSVKEEVCKALINQSTIEILIEFHLICRDHYDFSMWIHSFMGDMLNPIPFRSVTSPFGPLFLGLTQSPPLIMIISGCLTLQILDTLETKNGFYTWICKYMIYV